MNNDKAGEESKNKIGDDGGLNKSLRRMKAIQSRVGDSNSPTDSLKSDSEGED